MKSWILLFIAIVASLTFLLFMGLLMPVRAEIYTMTTMVCDETKVFLNELAEKYHEQEIAGSVDGDGNLVRLFSSSHTWTILRSSPNGTSCTLDAGKDWETLPAEIKGKKT